MTIDPPACMECRHYRGARACAAFPAPGPIPDIIWLGGDPHTGPIDGDHGIRFERGTRVRRDGRDGDDAPARVYVSACDGVLVLLMRAESDHAVGDLVIDLRPGEEALGKTYEQWAELGSGAHPFESDPSGPAGGDGP